MAFHPNGQWCGCEPRALPYLGSAGGENSRFITISGLHKVEGQGASPGRSITSSRWVVLVVWASKGGLMLHIVSLLQAVDRGVAPQGVAGVGNVARNWQGAQCRAVSWAQNENANKKDPIQSSGPKSSTHFKSFAWLEVRLLGIESQMKTFF